MTNAQEELEKAASDLWEKLAREIEVTGKLSDDTVVALKNTDSGVLATVVYAQLRALNEIRLDRVVERIVGRE